MASWWTEYSREARNYLDDNGSLVADLFIAIERLVETEGIPVGGATQIAPGELLFQPANHLVIYERSDTLRRIRVTVIKPKPEVE